MRELREIRLRRGLSQADLSAMTGVAEFTISEIEAGKRANPRPSTLRKLAQGLGVEVTDLYGELDSPLGVAPSSQEKLFKNGGLEEERRAAEYKRWADFVNRCEERWKPRIESGDLNPRAIEEFAALLADLGPILPQLGLREKRELDDPEYAYTYGPIMGEVLQRLMELGQDLINAGEEQFDASQLEQLRRKQAEQKAALGETIRGGESA